jgi:hypothetical protein
MTWGDGDNSLLSIIFMLKPCLTSRPFLVSLMTSRRHYGPSSKLGKSEGKEGGREREMRIDSLQLMFIQKEETKNQTIMPS